MLNKEMEELLKAVPIGRANAIKLNNNTNRVFRRYVAEANTHGDLIINVGTGYFRPDVSDPVEREMTEHYLAAELTRARAIQYKRLKMQKTYEQLLDNYGFTRITMR